MTPNATTNIVRQTSQLRERVEVFLGTKRARSKNAGEKSSGYLFDQNGDWAGYDVLSERSHVGHFRDPTRPIQTAVHEIIEKIDNEGWGAYLVGGTLRDLMLAPRGAGVLGVFPRDIDIVVLGTTLPELERCFTGMIRRRTRFGGLHLVKEVAGVCEVDFDIWPLEETWAFKAYHEKPDISIFPRYPFLNMDAIAMDLLPRDKVRQIFDQDEDGNHVFFRGLSDQTIDINFEPNPYPDVCAVRGLIIAAKLGFGIGVRLARFICERARMSTLDSFLRAQESHYGQVRSEARELQSWIDSIKRQLESGAERVVMAVPQNRQLGLWTDYPPMPIAAAEADQVAIV